eukprot:5774663-Amphidinium_carterae.2
MPIRLLLHPMCCCVQGYLVDHPLFKFLRHAYPESLSRVCEALSQHSYDKGRAIFTAGSIARCLYITSQVAQHQMFSRHLSARVDQGID